jgi:hypothetical protein
VSGRDAAARGVLLLRAGVALLRAGVTPLRDARVT